MKIINRIINIIIEKLIMTPKIEVCPKISKEDIRRAKIKTQLVKKSIPKLTPIQKKLRKWMLNL